MRWIGYEYALIIFALVGFMTKANDNKFTTEPQLTSRYSGEIADFWLTGEFAHFNGVDNARINYVTFIHNEANNLSTDFSSPRLKPVCVAQTCPVNQ